MKALIEALIDEGGRFFQSRRQSRRRREAPKWVRRNRLRRGSERFKSGMSGQSDRYVARAAMKGKGAKAKAAQREMFKRMQEK